MKRVYRFNDGLEMVQLAREIQTKIYWHNHFYIEETIVDPEDKTLYVHDVSVDYDNFWDLCIHAISEGATAVEINECSEDIRFLK